MFVLDIKHDKHARFALRAYAVSIKGAGNEEFYQELINLVENNA